MVLMAVSNDEPTELPDDKIVPDETEPLPAEEPVKTDAVPDE